MNTDKGNLILKPEVEKEYPVERPRHKTRPFLLVLLGFLLVFGIYFFIMMMYQGAGGVGGGSGTGSGLSGDGSGSGTKGTGRGYGPGSGSGVTAGSSSGGGAGDTGKKTEEKRGLADGKKGIRSSVSETKGEAAVPQELVAAAGEVTKEDKEAVPSIHLFTPPDVRKKEPVKRKYMTLPEHETAASKGTDSSGSGSYGKVGKEGFYGVRHQGNVLFIVDTSGSMAAGTLEGTRIEILKRQLLTSITTTAKQSGSRKYSIISFSDSIDLFPGGKHVQVKFSDQKKSMEKFVRGLQACGGTSILLAWQKAAELIQKEKITVNTIFFLSDGEPTDSDWQTIHEFINKKINKKIIINTISIGTDSRDMAAVAKKYKGKYRCIK